MRVPRTLRDRERWTLTEIEEQLSRRIRRHELWSSVRATSPDLSDWREIGAILGMLHQPGRIERFGYTREGLWMWLSMPPGEDTLDYHHGATPGEPVARALLAMWGEP